MGNIGKVLFFIVLFLLTISICNVVLKDTNSDNQIEGFENGQQCITKSKNDIYDQFYASIYDFIAFDDKKNQFEIQHIIGLTHPDMTSVILDIGSGMGHHVKHLNENYCGDIIGVDKSQDMVNYSKKLYPDISASFYNIDVMSGSAFPRQHFSHILCLYFTIYYIDDKKTFLQHCFNWLQNNSYMVLHLVNRDVIKTILKPDRVNGITANYEPNTTIEFNKFEYTSKFDDDGSPNKVIFKEEFTFKDGKKRIHEHSLYMNDEETILNYARSVGFIIHGKVEMVRCDYEDHYLYIFKKPY